MLASTPSRAPSGPAVTRLSRFVALLALVAVVGAGCGSGGNRIEPPAAARVGDAVLTQDELFRQAEVLSGQPGAAEFMAGASPGTYSTSGLSSIVTQWVQGRLAIDHVQRNGIEVTEEDQTNAETFVSGQGGETLPDDLRVELLDATAASYALARAVEQEIGVPEITRAQLEELYEAEIGTAIEQYGDFACTSHLLVSTDARSLDEAQEIIVEAEARLADGEEFAAVASELSDDTQSGPAGGDLGCNPTGQFVPAFDEAAFSQEIGEVGEAVETELGLHLILVRSRGVPPLEEFETQLRSYLEQEAEQERQVQIRERLLALFADVEVDIDPRYGTWDPATAQVLLPEGPVPPSTTTTIPELDLESLEGLPADVGGP